MRISKRPLIYFTQPFRLVLKPSSVKSLSSLANLKASELKDVALAVGAGLSGNKSDIRDGILGCIEAADVANIKSGMSIISIDMGIRNLAYAQVIVPPAPSSGVEVEAPNQNTSLILDAWRRLDITSQSDRSLTEQVQEEEEKKKDEVDLLESEPSPGSKDRRSSSSLGPFEPAVLAQHAYRFVDFILSNHKPTHILIERQRFRSGGASAVLEWSLRVGVFEGMLHALFNGLAAERGLPVQVCSIDPGRVTRFWAHQVKASLKAEDRTDHVKKFKIDMAARCLQAEVCPLPSSSSSSSAMIQINPGLQESLVNPFLQKAASLTASSSLSGNLSKKSRRKATNDTPTVAVSTPNNIRLQKIDDLADSLLSAITWLQWQRMACTLKQQQQQQESSGAEIKGKEEITQILDQASTALHQQVFSTSASA